MTRTRTLIVALLLLTALPLAAADPAPAKLFFVQFSLGPSWVKEKPPNEQTMFAEHGRNLKRLRDAGVITFGGRTADKGILVAKFADDAAARAELEADPGVQAGIFKVEVSELRPFYEGCIERPK